MEIKNNSTNINSAVEYSDFLENTDTPINIEQNNPSMAEINQKKSLNKFSKKEKILVSCFLFFGIGILILGFLQFYSRKTITLYDVFGIEKNDKIVKNDITPLIGSNTNNQINNELRLIDTDKDGLNDYDELYSYGTSPYIEDTDSDGIFDKQEIDKGENPNCPKGKTCGFSSTPQNTQPKQEPISLENILDMNVNNSLAQEGFTELEKKMVDGSLDAKGLRDILIKNGASQDLLAQVNDDKLLELYKTTLGAVDNNGGVNSLDILNDFKDLSTDEIRKLMISGGVEESAVNALSDEQVKDIFNKTFESLKTQN